MISLRLRRDCGVQGQLCIKTLKSGQMGRVGGVPRDCVFKSEHGFPRHLHVSGELCHATGDWRLEQSLRPKEGHTNSKSSKRTIIKETNTFSTASGPTNYGKNTTHEKKIRGTI